VNSLVRAKRILAPMASFKAPFKNELPSYIQQAHLERDEQFVGVYANVLDTHSECVVVTDRRLLVERHGDWETVLFCEIISVEAPEPTAIRRDTAALTIGLSDGALTVIPIRGGHGRFFDVYEFSRFVMRVRDDVKRNGPRMESK